MYPYPVIYDWQNFTILIVEDDFSTIFYFKEILKDTGITIEIAENGEQAVELCRTNTDIDIILMDIQLPFMNGLTATSEIKKILPSVPVIAQTAYAMPYDLENCLIAGCTDCITKPVDSYELLEKINRNLVR